MVEGGDAMIERTTRVVVGTVDGETEINVVDHEDEFQLRVVTPTTTVDDTIQCYTLSREGLAELVAGIQEAFLDNVIDVTLTAHRHRYDESGACRKEGCEGRRQRARKAGAVGAGA
jgi:hypothetical protein